MRVCLTCGTPDEAGEPFCVSCGTFLEGNTGDVGEGADERPPDGLDLEQAREGLARTEVAVAEADEELERAQRRVRELAPRLASAEEALRALPRGDAADVARAHRRVRDARRRSEQAEAHVSELLERREAAGGALTSARDRAARVQHEVSGQVPLEQVPTEQVRARPRPSAAPVPAPAEGEHPCPQCGRGNDPARRFCARCGADLHPVVEAAPGPDGFWTRLRRRLSGAPGPARRVGDPAPRRRRRPRPGSALAVLAGVVALGVVVGVTPLGEPVRDAAGDGADAVRDRFDRERLTQVRPTAARASASVGGDQGSLAIDGVTSTAWVAPAPATGAALTVQFARPVDLVRIGVRLGQAGSPASFVRQARPRLLQVVVDGQEGALLSLDDEPGLQVTAVDLPGTARLSLRVISVQPGIAVQTMPIAEVSFFTDA